MEMNYQSQTYTEYQGAEGVKNGECEDYNHIPRPGTSQPAEEPSRPIRPSSLDGICIPPLCPALHPMGRWVLLHQALLAADVVVGGHALPIAIARRMDGCKDQLLVVGTVSREGLSFPLCPSVACIP